MSAGVAVFFTALVFLTYNDALHVDQCAAMAAAVKTTLPHKRHRWCLWHILRNAKENLGGIYSKLSTFKVEFNALVSKIISTDEFEEQWMLLV